MTPTPTPTPPSTSTQTTTSIFARADTLPMPENNQFIDRVYPDELDAIAKRRENLNSTLGYSLPPVVTCKNEHRPNVTRGLSGLAFSGGGIRSACFNLGVIQALAKFDRLAHFDYLSTVSGGGYIGASLSLMLRRPGRRPNLSELPLHFDSEHARKKELGVTIYSEPPALRHLRNQARYLDSHGAFDYALIASLVMRNALINAAGQSILLVVLALLGLALMLVCQGLGLARPVGDTIYPFGDGRTPAVAAIVWAFLFLILRVDTRSVFVSVKRVTRERFRRLITAGTLLAGGAVLVWAVPWAVYHTRQLGQMYFGDHSASLAGVAAAGGVLYELAKVVGNTPSAIRRTLSAAVLIVIGPIIVWCLFAAIAGWLWFGPLRSSGHFEFTTNAFAWLQRHVFPHGFPLVTKDASDAATLTIGGRFVGLLGLCALLILLFWFDSNINRTSMHGFYRDRLSKLFIFDVDTDGAVRQNAVLEVTNSATKATPDRLKLSELFDDRQSGPYHLINTALNIQKANDENRLRGRSADFFLFSPRWTGSRATGYCQTADLEARDPTLTFASAIAISGAAASSYMGTQTNRLAAFSLALFNVRLGYWLPNPRLVAAKKPIPWYNLDGTAPSLFFDELTGRLSADDEYVNVSDGGHIENLAVFELLRRCCKWIVVCDAEADPKFEFPSLAKLVRLARTDLGVNITIDVSEIRPGNEADAKHFAVGTIRYPGDPADKPSGTFLYIKSSLAGRDEAFYLRQQPHFDKDFPHTSTADQFFDEQQFEAYRALGHHAATRLLEHLDANPTPDLTPWPARRKPDQTGKS